MVSKHKGAERGAWYEIQCIADNIRSKEAKGQDATYERSLLKSYSEYKGYESAKQVLIKLGKPTSSGIKNGL